MLVQSGRQEHEKDILNIEKLLHQDCNEYLALWMDAPSEVEELLVSIFTMDLNRLWRFSILQYAFSLSQFSSKRAEQQAAFKQVRNHK